MYQLVFRWQTRSGLTENAGNEFDGREIDGPSVQL